MKRSIQSRGNAKALTLIHSPESLSWNTMLLQIPRTVE